MMGDTDSRTSYLQDRPVLSPAQTRVLAILGPLIIASCSLLVADTNWLTGLENTTIDWRFQARGARAPRSDIVIVHIDEASRDALRPAGRQFELRRHLPAAINHLADAGAVVVGLDIYLEELTESAVDDALAEAIADANVVLAVTHTDGRTKRADPLFLASQPAEGVITVYPDQDGVLRRLPGDLRLDLVNADMSRTVALHFPLAVAMFEVFEPDEPVDVELGDGFVRIGERRVRGRALIDFCAPQGGGWRTLSLQDVVRNDFDPAGVDGSLVLIGESRSITDAYPMPLAGSLNPGVYYHANALAHLLDGRGFDESPSMGRSRLGLIGGLTLAAGLFAWNPRSWWRYKRSATWLTLYVVAGVVVFLGGWTWAAFDRFDAGVLLPLAAPLAGMAAGLGTGFAAQWVINSANLRRAHERVLRIEALFSRSVSAKVLEALKSDPACILETQVRDVSVLFCDIRGFTSAAAGQPPDAVARMLNEYFDCIAPAIFENDGFIDKFVGDEIMVVFSAPIEQADHPVRAVRTALAMKRRLAKLNQLRRSRNEPELQSGVGIHCGPAAVGHVGAVDRANYTVVGNTINVAARIEGFTKNGEVLISQAVHERLPAGLTRQAWQSVEIRGLAGRHALYVVPFDAETVEA